MEDVQQESQNLLGVLDDLSLGSELEGGEGLAMSLLVPLGPRLNEGLGLLGGDVEELVVVGVEVEHLDLAVSLVDHEGGPVAGDAQLDGNHTAACSPAHPVEDLLVL